jgi:hypothetical protein
MSNGQKGGAKIGATLDRERRPAVGAHLEHASTRVTAAMFAVMRIIPSSARDTPGAGESFGAAGLTDS